MIIDAHTHICTENNQSVMGYNFNLEDLIRELRKNKIDGAIVSLQIRFRNYICPNECRLICKNEVGDNCSSNCPHRNIHTLCLLKKSQKYVLYCKTCRKSIGNFEHFLRKENEDLIMQCHNSKFPLFPLVLINESEPHSHISEEIEYFESTYSGLFYGYKIHSHIFRKPLHEFGTIPTKHTILVHVGNNELCNMDEAIKFAKIQNGNVVLAHSGLFQKDKIKEALSLPNVYIDTAALYFMSRNMSGTDDIDNYQKNINFIFNYIPSDRLIWGSDIAYSNLTDELSLLKDRIFKENFSKNSISFLNAYKVYRLEKSPFFHNL